MPLNQILHKVDAMGDLPTLPEIVRSIRKVTEDEHASAADLANVILKDAALSSKVLRVVNSSFYSHYSGKVSTVTRAIVILGFTSVRDMALGLRIQEVLSRIGDGEHLKTFWTMSLASAICSRELAVKKGYPSPEEAFIAGLLQNVGQIILAQCCPEDYAEVQAKVRQKGRLAAERQHLRMDHAELGGALASHWHFPGNLQTALREHHREKLVPSHRHPEPLVDLVFVGHLLASCVLEPAWHGTGPEIQRVHAALDHLLGLSPVDVAPILKSLPESLTDLAAKLEIAISLPSSLQPAESLQAAAHPAHPGEDEVGMLHEISTAMVHGFDLDDLLQLILECLYRASRLRRVIMFVSRGQDGPLEGLMAFGLEDDIPVRTLLAPRPHQGNRLSELLSSGDGVHLRKPEDPDVLPESLRLKLAPGEFAVAPLSMGGKVRGMIYADNGQDSGEVGPEALHLLGVFANQAAIALALRGRG